MKKLGLLFLGLLFSVAVFSQTPHRHRSGVDITTIGTYEDINVRTISFVGYNAVLGDTVFLSGDKLIARSYATRRFTSTTPGLVPASGGGTINFLRADGTFAEPIGTNYTFRYSLTESSDIVNLVNDEDTPGNSKLYGTNGSGTKGWYDQPTGFGGGSGLTENGSNLDLGGTLTSPAIITGTDINPIYFRMTDATSSHSAKFLYHDSDGFTLRGYDGADFTGDSSFFSVDNGALSLGQYDGSSIKSFYITPSTMAIRDDDNSMGIVYYANYATAGVANPLWVPTYQAVVDTSSNQIGGVSVSTLLKNVSASEHGWVITYDSLSQEFDVSEVIPADSAAGVVLVKHDTILYSNTTVDTVVTLPEGAVIWEIHVYVETAFDGSGTDLLDVGIIGDADKYENDLDLSQGDKFWQLANLADRISSANTHVIFQYSDSGSDAANGQAYIYVKYSIHTNG